MYRSLFTLTLASLVALSVHAADAPQVEGEPAWTTTKQALDLSLQAPALPQDEVLQVDFPALPKARLDALQQHNALPGVKALQIGIERDARAEARRSASRPGWIPQADGRLVAQLRVTSPGAAALRSGLDVAQLPDGAELRFFGTALGAQSEGVATGAGIAALRQAAPLFWSPVTEGDSQLVEIVLPAGSDPQWAQLSLAAVSHLLVAPSGAFDRAKIGESDYCEYDAKCLENPTTAYNNAKDAVARMVFQKDGGSYLCTGTLLNDTDNSTQVPYFFSAAHCFTSQSIANTLTTYWFYETTTCGGRTVESRARQVAGGANVLYSSVAADVLFLRLNTAPPAGAYFLGWNAAPVSTGDNILVLHHPAGDVKKVSLGQVKGIGSSTLASGSFFKVGYTDGTTEGGSSGCGLLTYNGSQYQLRGGLLGGSAACSNSGSIPTPLNSDDFSRLDQVYSSLQQYLSPAGNPPPSNIDYSGFWNNSAQSGWGLNVSRGTTGTYGMVIYHYDAANTPAWYLSFGALSGTSYSAPVLSFTGPWFGLVPFNPALVTDRVSGTLTVNFTSATTANVSFTIDGRTVTTTLNKLVY